MSILFCTLETLDEKINTNLEIKYFDSVGGS